MTVCNKLTVSRLVLALLMTFGLCTPMPFGKTIALFSFFAAALTDYWDGRLARKFCRITTFGKLMDPLADKILVCSAFICFSAVDHLVSPFVPVIIIAREFLVTGLRLLAASQGTIISAERWGKHKTIWQIAVISLILCGLALRDEILPLFLPEEQWSAIRELYFNYWFDWLVIVSSWLVAALTVISGSVYFWKCRRMVMENV